MTLVCYHWGRKQESPQKVKSPTRSVACIQYAEYCTGCKRCLQLAIPLFASGGNLRWWTDGIFASPYLCLDLLPAIGRVRTTSLF